MFKQSRKKIILSIMLSLILLFAVTLSVILFASYRQIQRKSADILQDYINAYTLEQDPGKPSGDEPGREGNNPPPAEKQDYKLSTFYSVAFTEDGSVLAVDNGMKDVYTEEELVNSAREILAGKDASGRTGNLLFRVVPKEDYTLVAFMDNTVTDSTMETLVKNVLIVGGSAIVVLFLISLFLSKRIIRPLEENDRQQKQFVSDASHELKTPVAVINANAELLRGEIGENEWLSNIRYENERMGELVKQLLDLSRAESKEFPTEHLDFSRIVIGEALAFESLAFEKGKTIQNDVDEGILLTGSRTQLTQLVSILLDNAIRHSKGDGIEISLKRRGHNAILSVINDGEKIPSDKITHLFDRFYRVDEARTGDDHHYGLGLSIAKAVTEKHGGSISVSCGERKVCFTVSLPTKMM